MNPMSSRIKPPDHVLPARQTTLSSHKSRIATVNCQVKIMTGPPMSQRRLLNDAGAMLILMRIAKLAIVSSMSIAPAGNPWRSQSSVGFRVTVERFHGVHSILRSDCSWNFLTVNAEMSYSSRAS